MAEFRFERQTRTPYSEAYSIVEDGERIGRIDIHFATTTVEATLCLNEGFAEDRVRDLIEVIDDELVLPAGTIRDDFLVTVLIGREVGVFSDELLDEELIDEFEEEEDENGRNGDRP